MNLLLIKIILGQKGLILLKTTLTIMVIYKYQIVLTQMMVLPLIKMVNITQEDGQKHKEQNINITNYLMIRYEDLKNMV